MSAWTKVRTFTALVGLLSACQACSQPSPSGPSAASELFEAKPAGWRPLSTNMLMFHHVEEIDDASSKKTFIRMPDGAKFQDLYGNVIFSSADYRISGLTGDPNPFGPLVPSGHMERIDGTAAFVGAIDEIKQRLDSPPRFSDGRGEVFLFPSHDSFAEAADAVSSGRISDLSQIKRISEGCLYARVVQPRTKNEAAILLVHIADRELSLADQADRVCFNGFFRANIGIAPEKEQLILPGAPSGQDCTIARIIPVGDRGPHISWRACPTVPNRRAAMLLHYLERSAALGDAKAGQLLESIRKNCSDLARQGNRQDLSCN